MKFFLISIIFIFLFNIASSQDFEKYKVLNAHKDRVTYVTFNSEDNEVVSGSRDGEIIFWNTFSGEKKQSINIHTGLITHLQFDNSGKYMASASYDGTVKLIDLKTKKEKKKFNVPKLYSYDEINGNEPTFVCFEQNDKFIYFGGYNCKISKANIKSGENKVIYQDNDGAVTCGIISPDNKYLVFAVLKNIYFFNLETEKIEKKFSKSNSYKDYVCELSFIPESDTLLAAWLYGGKVLFWNWKTGKQLSSLNATPNEGSSNMGFGTDGQFAVTGNFYNKTKLWDLYLKKEVQILEGHKSEVTTFDFSDDNQFIATGSNDKDVILWKKRKDTVDIVITKIPKEKERPVKEKQRVIVKSKNIKLSLWDNCLFDGDTVTVFLNGKKVFDKLLLTKKKKVLEFKLNKNNNSLTVFAENEGSKKPNTMTVEINDGIRKKILTMHSNL